MAGIVGDLRFATAWEVLLHDTSNPRDRTIYSRVVVRLIETSEYAVGSVFVFEWR